MKVIVSIGAIMLVIAGALLFMPSGVTFAQMNPLTTQGEYHCSRNGMARNTIRNDYERLSEEDQFAIDVFYQAALAEIDYETLSSVEIYEAVRDVQFEVRLRIRQLLEGYNE